MRLARTGLLLLALLGAGPAWGEEPQPGPVDARTKRLPVGWHQIRVVEHTETVVAQVVQKVGVPFTRLTERHLSINGFPMKLNVIRAADTKGVERLLTTLRAGRGGAWYRRSGLDVIETATQSLLAARRIWAWLGLTLGDAARYTVAARIGLVDAPDYMEANVVFNHFLKREAGLPLADGRDPAKVIPGLVRDWTHGQTVHLVNVERPWFRATYTLPGAQVTIQPGPLTHAYVVAKPAVDLGLPYVDFIADVQVRARYEPAAVKDDPGSTAATAFWPAADPTLKQFALRLTKAAKTDRERVLALLRFVGLDIRYSGQMGSRYGVKQVFAQRFGHCWDKSDLLITFCRALGIPARQVAGWIPALHSGHVWLEVRLRDAGWIPVDATTTWLGISQDYIPLYATDSGAMPIVYLRMPTITQK